MPAGLVRGQTDLCTDRPIAGNFGQVCCDFEPLAQKDARHLELACLTVNRGKNIALLVALPYKGCLVNLTARVFVLWR